MTLGVLGFAFIGLIYFLIYRLKIRALPNYIWLLILTGLYIHLTLKLRNSPVEVTHFLEYGLLSIFIFRALIHHIKDKSIYFSAALIILLIGTLDEIIQWIIPGRVWNFKDVGLNVFSGGLTQLAIWQVIGPKSISEKFNPISLRILTSLFAFCLIILGLCASNTPNRVYSYTKQISWLSFLQKEESMSEFGYKYNDPEIGILYSRISPLRIQKIDYQRGKEYAHILNKTVSMNYRRFLKKYNPITNPFLHELRVHIFRRDKYYAKANEISDQNKKREFYLISFKENLILKKYFNKSTKNSVHYWDDDKVLKLDELIDKNKPYESAVSSNLFTSFSEKTMWIVIFILLTILASINFIWKSKKIYQLGR